MKESNNLVEAFPAITYPLFLITEKIIGKETLNKVLPDYQKVI
jgi:hypothetical protein